MDYEPGSQTEKIRRIVKRIYRNGRDQQKLLRYAADWKKAADELWAENPHHKQRYENYKKENLDEEAKASTEEILSGIRG